MKKLVHLCGGMILVFVVIVLSASAWDVTPFDCIPQPIIEVRVETHLGQNFADVFAEDVGLCKKNDQITDCEFCSKLTVYEFNKANNKYDILVSESSQTFDVNCGGQADFSYHHITPPTTAGKMYKAVHEVWKTSCAEAGLMPAGTASEVFTAE